MESNVKFLNFREKDIEENIWNLGLGKMRPKIQFIKEKKSMLNFIKIKSICL